MVRSGYIGRFAPSPSGELHFGSLIAALGSFLQARSCQGKWLVRIEDIDPYREPVGAASRILAMLEHYGLYWDDTVIYQSTRHHEYTQILNWLLQQHHAYYCNCTRRRIQNIGGIYDNYCRNRQLRGGNYAIRLKQDTPVYSFNDTLFGQLSVSSLIAEEDYIIHRRDGLFAYNLTVVVDDHLQGITEVVRGADLINTTVKQIGLFQLIGWQPPSYFHLPLAIDRHGCKLSKQNQAPALDKKNVVAQLVKALNFLGQPIPDSWQDSKLNELLEFAIYHWQPKLIPLQYKRMID